MFSIQQIGRIAPATLALFLGLVAGCVDDPASPHRVPTDSASLSATAGTSAGTSSTPDLAYGDFDGGTISPYRMDGGASSSVTVVDDPTGAGKGKVAQFSYANGTDINRWIMPANHSARHFFFAGDMYFPSGTANFTNNAVQRKLVYIRTQPGVGVVAGVVISLWGDKLSAWIVNSDGTTGSYGLAQVSAGAWHRLEVEVQANSAYSASDGVLRVWLDGALVHERTGVKLYSTDPGGAFHYDEWGVGYQRESAPGEAASSISEVRYFDRVSFSTKRVGP